MPTFTQGPDPCRRSLNCRELHDDPPVLIGNLTNCCCCNTCFSVRPGAPDLIETNWTHCCRCVPRLIFVQFVPDYPDEPCCAASSIPLINGGTVEDPWPITTYSGSIFGTSVTVELGRFDAGYGIAEDGDYAWRVVATKPADGLDVDEYFPIDHVVRSCLDVSGISIGSITGPAGCTGTLQLANYEVAHLPFVLREDVPSVTEVGVPAEPEFITLDPSCGACAQVCSKICVWGNRTIGGAREFLEFDWVDFGYDRGWAYFNAATDETEYIWLVENEYGECELVFDWTGSEPIDDQVINQDTACSCRMKEVVTASVGEETIGFTIRCGVCTSWNFFCGTCRCVPLTLCAQTYIDNVFTESLTLTWDSSIRAWTDGYDLAIHLEAGSNGCLLVPYVNGTALDATATRDCGDEHQSELVATLGKRHDPGNDFVNAEFTDYVSDSLFFIRISSLLEDCAIGACASATPCLDECGSHPPVLIVNVEGVNEEDPYEPSCDVTITIYYWELLTWAGTIVDYTCGYTGFAFVGFCPQIEGPDLPLWVRADLTDGGIELSYYLGSSTPTNCFEIDVLYESCDPYLGTTDWIQIGVQIACWCCNTSITKYRITVTEPA